MRKGSLCSVLMAIFIQLPTSMDCAAESDPWNPGKDEAVVTDRWDPTGQLAYPRHDHTATLLPDGTVLVAGGESQRDDPPLRPAELFDSATGAWTRTGAPAIGRSHHTATLLLSGKVLIAGGRSAGPLADAELYDPATAEWTATGSLNSRRSHHTATLLPDGRVLVVGGKNGETPLREVEIYDPEAGTWRSTHPLAHARVYHTATLLPSGQVLVVGGENGVTQIASVELFDPATETWTTAARLTVRRAKHIAVVLASGAVLVAGGERSSKLTSVEIYDPDTGTWSAGRPLRTPRADHTATLLPSGKVLVADGVSRKRAAEIYDPITDDWQAAAMPGTVRRSGFTATLLPSGQVLLTGGAHQTTVELYSSGTGTWMSTESMTEGHDNHTATLLPSGKVLVVGSSSAELYDPTTGTWEVTGSPNEPRWYHTATLLASGKVLIAGGYIFQVPGERTLDSAELYDPETGTWRFTGSLPDRYRNHVATLLASGEVLVTGGLRALGPNTWEYSRAAQLYDPEAETWTEIAPLNFSRFRHTATLLSSGRVLVAGGKTPIAELYDPAVGTWTEAGSLSTAREYHSATLLRAGQVLVVGGEYYHSNQSISSAELYDPATGTWQPAYPLLTGRGYHTATLLFSGQVLVTGGRNEEGSLASTELYDPATGIWLPARPLTADRARQTATLLPSGQALIAGGRSVSDISWDAPMQSAELYAPDDVQDERRPVITSAPSVIRHGSAVDITGTRFRGISETGDGTTRNSTANFPLVQLIDVENGHLSWLPPDPQTTFGSDPTTLTVSHLPAALNPGPHLLRIVTAGIASEAIIVHAECGPAAIIEQPADQRGAVGGTATFRIKTEGGRSFQWQKNGVNIPGAGGPVYTTPPLTGSDSGTTYRVRVASGCSSLLSEAATLTVDDLDPPSVTVVSPRGGDFWLPSSVVTVSWSMADNVRICRVEASLIYSDDGGVTYTPAVTGVFGPGGACAHPGEGTTSVEYTVPSSPPSGRPGSLYKVRIRAIDHAGLETTAESEKPFFIVQPNDASVKTLILTHVGRLQSQMGISSDEAESLAAKIRTLANHPRVQGVVVDLGGVRSVSELYAAWDEEPARFDRANRVLFDEGGIHDHLLELLDAFTGVEYLILVGDDRIIPMARIEDRTVLFLESNYTTADDLNAGLSSTGTTVGRALAADRFLSDDPLAARFTVRPADLGREGDLFHPELSVGRMVETPEEIGTAIAVFISQDGLLDLTALDPETGHKVLVTGYDFLLDSGRNVRARWKNAFGLPHDDAALAPVNGWLLSGRWGEDSVRDRRLSLQSHLEGHGGGGYAIANLNGHGTHYELGVPGEDRFDVRGLNTGDLFDSPFVAGSVIYAVGCHGGLSVPGSDAGDGEHSLDLPQSLLGRGAMVYLANSGYGWGLLRGIGLSERMVEIFTEELTQGGTVVSGEAVKRTKLRYFMESPGFDAYEKKTSMQWTFYGLPMYAIATGIAADEGAQRIARRFLGVPRKAGELPAVEQLGAVTVKRRFATEATVPYLTRLEESFDLTAGGIYNKHGASGEMLAEVGEGCPDTDGCYYTLNGLATGTADLPIEPHAVFDSRLSGTSQHGILWKGGSYEEENGWRPVFAELVSNGGDGSNHGVLPRQIYRKPRGPQRRILSVEEDCRASDLELSSIVLTTGELGKAEADGEYSIHRLHREVDLEVFYYNNTFDGQGNCDRTGPVLGPGPYHEVRGTTIHWNVAASDEGGVWRVLVVYGDETLDDQGRGRWIPLELTDDGSGSWRGSLRFAGPARITYYLQAVDRRGNVSWLEHDAAERPASGVELGIPLPVEVAVVPGAADLAVALIDAPDPVSAGQPLVYTIAVHNLGPDPASSIVVTSTLHQDLTYVFAGGEGWSCGESTGEVTCTRDTLAVGSAPEVSVLVAAPAKEGVIQSSVAVRAAEEDPVADNNNGSESTWATQDRSGRFGLGSGTQGRPRRAAPTPRSERWAGNPA